MTDQTTNAQSDDDAEFDRKLTKMAAGLAALLVPLTNEQRFALLTEKATGLNRQMLGRGIAPAEAWAIVKEFMNRIEAILRQLLGGGGRA